MAKTIYDVTLAELLPPGMTDDPKIAALAEAMDAQDAVAVNAIGCVSVQDNVGGQKSDVTDLLALELRAPYYNQALPLETRRALVAGAGMLNSIRGTKTAVEAAVREAFGTGTMQVWYEYGGNPHHFKILINDFPNSDAQSDEILRAINETKQQSSILDAVVIIAATSGVNLYAAAVVGIKTAVKTTMQAPK